VGQDQRSAGVTCEMCDSWPDMCNHACWPNPVFPLQMTM
jgi:hypothetical protein